MQLYAFYLSWDSQNQVIHTLHPCGVMKVWRSSIWDAVIEIQSNMTKTEVWLPVIHNLEVSVLTIRMAPLF